MVLLSISACSLDTPLNIPYGKWENAEIGIVLNIDPILGEGGDTSGFRIRRFPGTYVEEGETVDIVVAFFVAQVSCPQSLFQLHS